MYKNYGLYLVKHFVVALTNVCTVKLAQLHKLIRFNTFTTMSTIIVDIFFSLDLLVDSVC